MKTMLEVDQDFSVDPQAFVDALIASGIDYVVTVPDFLQISVHLLLEAPATPIEVIHCATEDQAVEVAAGLHIGGKRSAILMQNQGFYASVNSIRAIGLDAGIPLLLVVGQFGREFSNFGKDSRHSERRMVSLLEPMLDTLKIPYFNIERAGDVGRLGLAAERAQLGSSVSVAIVGAYTGW